MQGGKDTGVPGYSRVKQSEEDEVQGEGTYECTGNTRDKSSWGGR